MTLMLTDPISDYLTRVRNAIAAQHAEVEIPSSRLKRRSAAILASRATSSGFAVEPTPVGEVIKIQLKYTDGRRSVITGLQRSRGPAGGATSPTGRSRG